MELGGPLLIDGVHISPTDIDCGDADGLVVIPAASLDEVFEKASELFEQEETTRSQKYGRSH